MRHLPARSILVLVPWLALACDPSEAVDVARKAEAARHEKKPDPAKEAADAAKAKVAADEAAKEAAAVEFATCMAACTGPDVQSPTDRQTCRLRCGADDLPEDDSGMNKGILAITGRFQKCMDDGCTEPDGASNAVTCRLTCAQSAVSGDGPQALAEPQRGCSVSCLEQMGDCETECKGSADDKATCKLQCTTVGQRCLARCEEDPEAAEKAKNAVPPEAPPTPEAAPEVSIPEGTAKTLPNPDPPAKEEPSGVSVPEKTTKKLPAP